MRDVPLTEGLGGWLRMWIALPKRALKDRGDEARLCQRVLLSGLHRASVVAGCQLALQGQILLGDLWIGAKEVAEREVLALLLAASHAEVDVVTGWPPGWFLEERVDEIELAKEYVDIANTGQPMTEARDRAEIANGNLDINDRLRRQAWH